MRESRKATKFKGSLKGLSAREYYQIEARAASNLSSACAKYLPENLWKKYDRGKPLRYSQAMLIFDALNRAAFDTATDLPFETPVVKIITGDPKLGTTINGRVVILKSVSILKLPKVITDAGTCYLASKQIKMIHDGKEGLVAFSRHAIERMMERVPNISNFAKQDTLIPVRMLRHTAASQVISKGDRGPQLRCGFDEQTIGYFPFVWENGMWICTTFLETDMQGTAKTEQKAIEAGLEELRNKFSGF